MSSDFLHLPVLRDETLAHLALHPGALIVDGTLGGAGHAASILEATAPDGVLVGFDVDPDALAAAGARLAAYGDRVKLVHGSFRDMESALQQLGIECVDGVLLDLGVSSPQLDRPERGFRFAGGNGDDTPLDMRMDPTSEGETAAELLARASADQLQHYFQEYGELPGSKRLARTIVEERRETPLRTAADLLRVIERARVGGGRKHNPATLVFQALRIAVNDELGALSAGLLAAIELLRPGGRVVVIAYHSLEDRIVKRTFRAAAKGCTCPPELPACVCGRKPAVELVTRRPVRPGEDEIRRNPRARSALLRCAERLEAAA